MKSEEKIKEKLEQLNNKWLSMDEKDPMSNLVKGGIWALEYALSEKD